MDICEGVAGLFKGEGWYESLGKAGQKEWCLKELKKFQRDINTSRGVPVSVYCCQELTTRQERGTVEKEGEARAIEAKPSLNQKGLIT